LDLIKANHWSEVLDKSLEDHSGQQGKSNKEKREAK
jgi:hypothetical protein